MQDALIALCSHRIVLSDRGQGEVQGWADGRVTGARVDRGQMSRRRETSRAR